MSGDELLTDVNGELEPAGQISFRVNTEMAIERLRPGHESGRKKAEEELRRFGATDEDIGRLLG